MIGSKRLLGPARKSLRGAIAFVSGFPLLPFLALSEQEQRGQTSPSLKNRAQLLPR